MEKLLIGSLELDNTQTGKPVVELYSTNTALQFPELRLFDLSALVAIGIDPNELTPGVRVHKRFWAYYTLSEKTNQRGNPYRDVAHLEAIDQPATATSTDTSPLLAELRAMNALLLTIAAAVGADGHPPQAPAPYTYTNGDTATDNPHERQAFDAYLTAEGHPPPDVDALRAWVLDTANPRTT